MDLRVYGSGFAGLWVCGFVSRWVYGFIGLLVHGSLVSFLFDAVNGLQVLLER